MGLGACLTRWCYINVYIYIYICRYRYTRISICMYIYTCILFWSVYVHSPLSHSRAVIFIPAKICWGADSPSHGETSPPPVTWPKTGRIPWKNHPRQFLNCEFDLHSKTSVDSIIFDWKHWMAGVCVTVWFPEILGFPSKDLNFGVFGQKTRFGPMFFGPILRWFGQGGKRALSSKPQKPLIDGFFVRLFAYCQRKKYLSFLSSVG